MKKIILFVFVLMSAIVLTGCGVKKEKTDKEFTDELRNKGFTVNDVTFMNEDPKVENLLVAKKAEYEIEFRVYKKEEDAKKAFEGNKKAFMNYKKQGNKDDSVDADSYQKYTLALADDYDVVIRNGKTLLYASINIQYKKDLNKVIKSIGY